MKKQITHYSILNVPEKASQEEIRAVFKRLMEEKKKAGVPFDPLTHKRLLYAYKVLGNRHSRVAYDKQLLQMQMQETKTSDGLLTIEITFSRNALTVTDSPQLLYALLEITAVDRNEEVDPPLNISIIVDRSTSMHGARMERVKTAISNLINNLAPDDVISIISFSDRAQVVQPSGRAFNKTGIIAKVRSIQTSGGTEIYQGLSTGVQQIKQVDLSKYNNQLILLTDGHTYGDAEHCQQLARRVARDKVGITAFGIGSEWNDQFLDELVAPSGGRSIYINHPNEIISSLQQNVEGLGNIFARDIIVQPQFADSIVVRNVFKLTPFAQPVPYHNKEITLGHLETRVPLTTLIEFEVSPQPKEVQLPFSIALKAEIPHENKKKYSQTVQYMLRVSIDVEETQPSTKMLKAVRLFNLYQMNEKAWSEAESGQFDMATLRMQNISTRLLEAGEEMLAQQAQAETQRLSDMETVSIDGRKELKYGTRALMQQFAKEG